MVEVKALQPVVRVRMVQTVFEDPCVTAAEALQHAQDREGSAAAAGVVTRIQIDSQIRALLEYSTDGLVRVTHTHTHTHSLLAHAPPVPPQHRTCECICVLSIQACVSISHMRVYMCVCVCVCVYTDASRQQPLASAPSR